MYTIEKRDPKATDHIPSKEGITHSNLLEETISRFEEIAFRSFMRYIVLPRTVQFSFPQSASSIVNSNPCTRINEGLSYLMIAYFELLSLFQLFTVRCKGSDFRGFVSDLFQSK